MWAPPQGGNVSHVGGKQQVDDGLDLRTEADSDSSENVLVVFYKVEQSPICGGRVAPWNPLFPGSTTKMMDTLA